MFFRKISNEEQLGYFKYNLRIMQKQIRKQTLGLYSFTALERKLTNLEEHHIRLISL